MMNRKLLISLFAGLLLALGAGAAWAQEVKCPPIEKDQKCHGDRHYPIVTINTETKIIRPEFVCAARGSVIEFRVVPPGQTDSDSVDVKAKDPSNTWLIGANYPDKMKIIVRVPRWIDKGIHSYNIFPADFLRVLLAMCRDTRGHSS